MKLCYQVATPDVKSAQSVTAYQGAIDESFSALAGLGYDGVELMTLDPGRVNRREIRETADQLGLAVTMVCTGEVFGQLGLSFADRDAAVRREAIARVEAIIDFASFFNAKVNIGRVRGQYLADIPREQTHEWAVEAFGRISDYAQPKGVEIALETVCILQTNFVNTLAEAKHMLELTGRQNFRLMMDVFHMNIEEKDLLAAIPAYCPDTAHVHLSDNNRRYPGHCGLDFEKILRAFHACGYDATFCIEAFQEPSMEHCARESIRHLAPMFRRVYGRAERAPLLSASPTN